ncbi:MAG: hypothetical protein ACODAU_01790 [Myxococcota bacterium]
MAARAVTELGPAATARDPETPQPEPLLALAMDGPPPQGGAPSASGTDAAAVADLLGRFGPELLVAALQMETRDAQAGVHGKSVEAAEARGELAEKERQEAIEAARKAAKKASGIFGLKGPIAKLVKAVVTVAATAASALSGGTLAGLAIAGAALMLAAGPVCKGLVKSGILNEKQAKWVSLGIQLAGMLLSGGAGLAQLGNPQTIASLAKTVAQVVQGAGQVAQGALQVRDGVFQRRHAGAMADAEAAKLDSDASGEAMNEAIAQLEDLFETFQRVQQRLRVGLDVQHEARLAATQARA